jgi:hypothetical protein
VSAKFSSMRMVNAAASCPDTTTGSEAHASGGSGSCAHPADPAASAAPSTIQPSLRETMGRPFLRGRRTLPDPGSRRQAATAPDVDGYSASTSGWSAGTSVYAACRAQCHGSGLRGLTLPIVEDGNTLGTTGTETATSSAYTSEVALPTSVTTVFLEVYGGTQDATVTGTYYDCGIYFYP